MQDEDLREEPFAMTPLQVFCGCFDIIVSKPRKVDMMLPGKESSNSNGARPVHQIISMIERIRASRLSRERSLSLQDEELREEPFAMTPLQMFGGCFDLLEALILALGNDNYCANALLSLM